MKLIFKNTKRTCAINLNWVYWTTKGSFNSSWIVEINWW